MCGKSWFRKINLSIYELQIMKVGWDLIKVISMVFELPGDICLNLVEFR